jgi:nucleoid DNA-binding protein
LTGNDDSTPHIPQRVEDHLNAIAKEIGITQQEEAVSYVRTNWLEKRRLFAEQVAAVQMEFADTFLATDPRGALFFTYSASLIMVGPIDPDTGGRSFEYASIKLRTDVPPIVTGGDARLAETIRLDQPAAFDGVGVQRSSEINGIATFTDGVARSDQSERLRQAMIFLTNGFVHANRTLSTVDEGGPDQFDIRSIVRSVAERNGSTQTLARRIIDDYISTVEAGALLGGRVSLGSLGRVFLDVRNPQKARMGRNPSTGEEILIPAKPPQGVPKIGFSSSFKERARRVPIERIDPTYSEGESSE